jgi:hypothetical protein
MGRLIALALVLPWLSTVASHRGEQPAASDERIVLVTIDGARTEEVFGGLDVAVLQSTLRASQRVEETSAYRRYWAPTREERRRTLMPFFWNLVTDEGSLAGDAESGSHVRLSNSHWFSYPGYAEILLGEPHDAEIKSNDPVRNPFPTVLEAIKDRLKLSQSQVATFASWPVFNHIVEHTEGATLVNAGVEPMDGADSEVRLLNALQSDAVTPWEGTRSDAFTFRLAMKHLATARPRVLYIAFDETDDWAHDGRYPHVLDAFNRTDGYLRELWTWLQSQADYRGRTHLLVTTDHGRGHTTKDWRDHGAKVDGANEVWIAFASPRMSARGLWRDHSPLSTSQIAATLAAWEGLDWNAIRPNAGRPIRSPAP